MIQGIGIRSLAISVPERELTNEYWLENHPETVQEVEQRLWMWKKPKDVTEGSTAFNLEMQPYVTDPFRGARRRRHLSEGQPVLLLERQAARQALDLAGLSADDVSLLICTSFPSDSVGIGGAAFLAGELELKGAAWNLESACSSWLLAVQTGMGLIESGQESNVLVVTSCAYSKVTELSDPISWGIGDAAVAAVLTGSGPAAGLVAGYSVHTADTCGSVEYRLEPDINRQPVIRLRVNNALAADVLRKTSERYLRECCFGALAAAKVGLEEIDFFVFNTPLAWYSAFCARALGIDPDKTINVYPEYSNAGPALPGLNLYHACKTGRIRPGSWVLVYTVGSVSSCAAAVFCWGEEVGIGESVLPATEE